MKHIQDIIRSEYKKIKKETYIKNIVLEEHTKLKEDAGDIRSTLDKLDYKEKTNQLDSGGNIPNYASILFRKFFEFLKDENPDVIIKVTAGHDKFHKKYRSRHNFGEALDFTVEQGNVEDVAKTLKKFKAKHGSEFKFLDEYKHPSTHSTGPHFHISYIGSQSKFNQSKKSGAAGEKQQSGMNLWHGEDKDGTDLETLDKMLAKLAAAGKGSTFGKMVAADYTPDPDQQKFPNHKWIIRAAVKAPEAEAKGKLKPNKDGILVGAPETITFYPNGNAHLYNQSEALVNVEIEKKRMWLARYKKALTYANPLFYAASKTKPIQKWADLEASVNPEVITLYNLAGDSLGTLYNDSKYGIVFDLSETPQYAVDEEGNVKWGHGKGMNIFQTILDIAGFIPFYGDIIDLINAVIYYIRGKNLEAVLSVIAIIPIVGSVIKYGAKGAMKVGGSSAKLFFKKISFGKLFKSASKEGVDAAQQFIAGLKKSGVIDSKDLIWLSKSGALDVIYKGLTKTDSFMKKYLPKTAYSSVDEAIDALQAMTKNLEGGITAVKNSKSISKGVKKFGPDAIKRYKQTKIGSYAGRGSKILNKVLLFTPFKRLINFIGQRFARIPASRLKYIDEILNTSIVKELKTNKTKLGFLIRTMDPVQVFKILDPKRFKQLGKKFAAGKGNINPEAFKNIVNSKYLDDLLAKTGEDQINAIIKVAKESDNIFFKTMAGSPEMWFKSQMDAGSKILKKDGGLWRAFRTSLGAKSFDLYYNETSELLQKELGMDFGQYGDENQSILLAPFYYGYEKATGKMDGFSNLRGNEEVNASLVKNITFVAKFLTLGQWDPSSYLQTHDQVWWPAWNEVPGDDSREKLLWVKGQTTDAEALKSIQKILDKDGSLDDDK